tara:strand:- start:764 stop:1354 length:591 start_codon:yes stop_codon:yes gene_type:complete
MEYYLGLLTFTFATSITPGPNNLMLLASGLNHGVKRSLPHYFGISLGFMLMVVLIGLGFGALFVEFPEIFLTIKILGVSYLLFLAWKIANAGRLSANSELKKPLSFFQAAAFQWVNPKAWIMAIGAIAAFTAQERIVESVATVSLVFLLASISCLGVWLLAGRTLQRFLDDDHRLRIFNVTTAILLVVSVVPMAFE